MNKSKLIVFVLIFGATMVAFAMAGTSDDAGVESPSAEELARRNLPVVTSNKFKVTLGEYELIASTQSPVLRKSLIDENEKRFEFLEKIINMNLLAAEATRRGYDKNQEVMTVRKNRLATLMQNEIAERHQEQAPTEEELRKYYEENISRYKKPEKVRARHIQISNKEAAAELLAQLLKEDTSQYAFRRLAQEKSEDKFTKNRGGDLTFISRAKDRADGDPEVDDRLAQAAFAIDKNGAIFPHLVETDKGYHIVMRTGHRKAMNLSFEDARLRLEKLVAREVHQEKTDGEINALKAKYNVLLMEENLKHVVIDLSSGPQETAKSLMHPKPETEKAKQ